MYFIIAWTCFATVLFLVDDNDTTEDEDDKYYLSDASTISSDSDVLGAVSEAPNKSLVKTRNVANDDDEDTHYLSDTGNITREKKFFGVSKQV